MGALSRDVLTKEDGERERISFVRKIAKLDPFVPFNRCWFCGCYKLSNATVHLASCLWRRAQELTR